MNVWIVTEEHYYSAITDVESVHDTKKLAEAHCRRDGYKWDKFRKHFNNEKAKMIRWLDKLPVNKQKKEKLKLIAFYKK